MALTINENCIISTIFPYIYGPHAKAKHLLPQPHCVRFEKKTRPNDANVEKTVLSPIQAAHNSKNMYLMHHISLVVLSAFNRLSEIVCLLFFDFGKDYHL